MFLYGMYFPLITKKFNLNYSKLEPWFTKGLIVSRNTKLSLGKIASNNPTDSNISKFKRFRNVYNRTVRAAKKLYFEKELTANMSNLKKTWQLIRSAANMRNVKKVDLSHFQVDGRLISDPLEIANKFNEFFTTMPVKIASEIIQPSNLPPGTGTVRPDGSPVFKLNNPISQTEILEAVKQLQPKKSQDFHGISMFFLKNVINSIITPLHHCVRVSLSTGIVPSQLKIAKVVPIFKSGDHTLMDNYRPISLLNNFSKIYEKVMANRLTSYIEENKLFSPSQYGFRKSHSTIHPLVQFMNTVSSALNKKHHVIAIFCDLRKAFDTVDHKILLKKLKQFGLEGAELEWFRSYLSNRKQFVFFEGKCSSLLEILLGVPQGSILGPLLFLIYINDLPLASSLLSSLFADDTTLSASGPDITELTDFVNAEFQKVNQFF